MELFEVMVLRGSEMNGRTLRSLNFRDRYDLTVLAINRHGDGAPVQALDRHAPLRRRAARAGDEARASSV